MDQIWSIHVFCHGSADEPAHRAHLEAWFWPRCLASARQLLPGMLGGDHHRNSSPNCSNFGWFGGTPILGNSNFDGWRKKTQTIEHHQPEWWNKSFWKWTLLCSDCLASYTFDVKIPWLLIQFGGCVNMITSFHSMVYHAIHAIEITIEITKLK